MERKKCPEKITAEIKKMQQSLIKLNAEGYILDFVEGSHCIVHVKSLKAEMVKPLNQINVHNYVVALLENF